MSILVKACRSSHFKGQPTSAAIEAPPASAALNFLSFRRSLWMYVTWISANGKVIMIQRLLPLGGILCATALLGACGPGHEWSHASSLDTVAAYQKFLSEYPTDPHAADAKRRIATLQDERAWTTAQIASTIAGYQQYVTAEPNGAHVQAARDEIVTRERDAAWQTVQTHPTAESLREFINKFPSSSEADEAREKLETIAGYRAELGAARSERLARRERDALERRFGKDLRQVVILEPDAKDPEYRITSAPMSEQDASAACETLQRSGRSCKVVQTTG